MTARIVAFVLACIVIVGSLTATVIVVGGLDTQCRFAQGQWDALHRVIIKSYTPPDPHRLPKELRKLVDPVAIRRQRDAVILAAGDRPEC